MEPIICFNAKPVDTNGMSLQEYVDHVTMDSVIRSFPEGKMNGYYEEEKGYTEDEVGFVDNFGNEYYVYARWGAVRIGARDQFYAKKLANYLRATLMQ